MLPTDYVVQKAKEAQAEGSTRFCMGAAWREVKDGKDFDAVLGLVESVHNLGMEVCCTLGMLAAVAGDASQRCGVLCLQP